MTNQVILIVEDDANDVLLLHRAFQKANIVVPLQTVSHGDDAVAYLAGEGVYADRERYPPPVLVLLDLKLPRRSGLEVLEWIRGQGGLRRLPVVVLTRSDPTGYSATSLAPHEFHREPPPRLQGQERARSG